MTRTPARGGINIHVIKTDPARPGTRNFFPGRQKLACNAGPRGNESLVRQRQREGVPHLEAGPVFECDRRIRFRIWSPDSARCP